MRKYIGWLVIIVVICAGFTMQNVQKFKSYEDGYEEGRINAFNWVCAHYSETTALPGGHCHYGKYYTPAADDAGSGKQKNPGE